MSQDRNQKLVKFSRLALSSKRDSSSSQPKEITQYFINSETPLANIDDDDEIKFDIENEQNKSVVSPFKSSTEIFNCNVNTSVNDEIDFKSPKKVFKGNLKQSCDKPCKSKQTKGRKKTKQLLLTKVKDCNEEHLHLAMVLSRSLQNDFPSTSETNLSTQQKIGTIKKTLLQFGFQSRNTSKIPVQNRRPVIEKKRKKSKFKYITPTLFLRTQEDRENLIAEKVTQLLSSDFQKPILPTFTSTNLVTASLQKQFKEESNIYKINSYDLESLNTSNNTFRVKSLNLPLSTSKCGVLLKNWSKIPGRANSPARITENEKPDLNHAINQSFINRSISPELFSSDDEIKEESKINTDPNGNSSESLLNLTPRKKDSFDISPKTSLNPSPVKKTIRDSFNAEKSFVFPNSSLIENAKGIYTFESFSSTGNEPVFDLTKSSDDETEVFNETVNNTSGISGIMENISTNDTIIQDTSCIMNTYNILEPNNDLCDNTIKNSMKQLEDDVFDLTQSSTDSLSPKGEENDFLGINEAPSRPCPIDPGLSPVKERMFSKHNSFNSTTSQESIYISDEELNYSSVYKTPSNSIKDRGENYDNDFPFDDEYNNFNYFSPSVEQPRSPVVSLSPKQSQLFLASPASLKNTESHLGENKLESTLSKCSANIELVTENGNNTSTTTPIKSNMIIKTSNITPMNNYDAMNTPKISKELEKFGLKPLKRQRGVQILKHIYDSTHPIVDSEPVQKNNAICDVSDEDSRIIKRRKSNTKIPQATGEKNSAQSKLIEPQSAFVTEEKIEIVGDLLLKNELPEDLVFEKKQSVKVSSCRVPLQIAWYNLVSSQPELKKNILLYEPLQLEVLYKLLKAQGYKYDIKDLLTFLDKKSITIRTNQNHTKKSIGRKKSVSPRKSN